MQKLKDRQDADQQFDPYSNDYARDLLRQDTETGQDAGVNAGVDQAEAFANDPNNASAGIQAAKQAEQEAPKVTNEFDWDEQNRQPKKRSFTAKVNNFAKKKGPFAFIGAILSAAFALIAFFGGPSLVLVHMSEIFGEAFDQQHPVLETRYRKMVVAKLENKTKGICSSVASYKCRYGSFSERELNKLRDRGVEALDSNGEPLLNEDGTIKERGVRAASMRFEGKDIPAAQYQRELRTNAKFRSANILSMNTKFVGMYDKVFNSYFRSIQASKGNPFIDAESDEDRDKTLTNNTRSGAPESSLVDRPPKPDPCDASCEEKYKRETERADTLDRITSEAQQNATDNVSKAKPGTLDKAANLASPIGPIDELCTIPYAINAVGTGAKVVRNAQMVRYAAMYLAIANSIKAGDARPQDVAFLANILTKVTKNQQTGERTKSGTDSFAFRYATNGDMKITESAGLALGAGGLGGKLNGVAEEIYDGIPGGRDTCDLVNNPVVQGAALLSNILPGVGFAGKGLSAGMKLVANKIISSLALNVAQDVALGMLLGYVIDIGIDMVSGANVDSDNLYGELAGDWVGSGTEEMFSAANGMGGALPLTPAQALAQEQTNRQIAAEYNQAEASVAHPLDASNPHSLVGMAYQNVLKTTGSISDASLLLLAPQRIIGGSLSLLSPKTQAYDLKNYEECEDYQYRENDIATTPFCHVVRGIPAPYIDMDPVAVSDWLLEREQIDEDGIPIDDSDYDKFIMKCFSNLVVADTSDSGDGNDCQIKDSDSQEKKDFKGYFAVHFVDERLSEIAENGLPEPENGGTSSTGGGDFTAATYNTLNSDGHADKSRLIAGKTCNRADDPNCGKARAVLQSKIILGQASYPQMDIIGTQETSPSQYRELLRNLPTYEGVPSDAKNIERMEQQKNGAVSILWNTEKFTKVNEGYAPALSNVANTPNRGNITSPWVELETNDGTQKLFVMSFHWPVAAFSDPSLGDKRTIQKGLQLALDWANEKVKEGTVLMMGDFNDHTNELTSYCGFTSTGVYQNSKDLAEGRPATKACPKPNPDFGIDHVYVSTNSGLTGSNWKHMPRLKSVPPQLKEENKILYQASDHTPMSVDLSFPGSDGGGTPGDFAWPVAKRFFDSYRADWLGAHFANSGTWTSGVDSLAADIGSPPDGTPVYAMFGGTVSKSDLGGHGLAIKTDIQGGTLEIAYAHGPRADQKTTYATGEKIMEIGCLGNCSGGHLHVDMAFNGKGVCPQDVFLAFSKGLVPNFQQLTTQVTPQCGGRL